jgi:hypothetical protein
VIPTAADFFGGSTGDRILRNSIFSDAQEGTDLGQDGPTPNDPGAPHGGANAP